MFLRLGDEGVPQPSSADKIALYAVYWYRDCTTYAAVQGNNVCSSHLNQLHVFETLPCSAFQPSPCKDISLNGSRLGSAQGQTASLGNAMSLHID